MSENLIYADLNLTESTRPRLQVTDNQGSTYAEVKVQSLDKNAAASYTSSGKSSCSRTCVAVLVAVIILLLVLAVCLTLKYYTTPSSPPDSKTLSITYEDCDQGWEQNGGKCYFFFKTPEKEHWNASRNKCINKGSDLVIIKNKKELDYLKARSDGHYYLLGLRYFESEKKWKWFNNVEHDSKQFHIEGHSPGYFCAVIGYKTVQTAPCDGSKTTNNMCEKAANISEKQKES